MRKPLFDTQFVGQNFIYLPTCQSTNLVLQDMAQKKTLPEGTLLLTDEQTKGRGQRNNTWEAQAGQNLTFSLLLKPSFMAAQGQFFLSMSVALAICETLQKYLGEALKIKWPNDLLYHHQKLGGILIENSLRGSRIEQSIVGIGVNVNQERFQFPRACSLKQLTGKNFELDNLVLEISKNIERYYLLLRQNRLEVIKSHYLANLYKFGQKHFYKTDIRFEAKIVDVDSLGRLVLERNHQRQVYNFKEVAFCFEND